MWHKISLIILIFFLVTCLQPYNKAYSQQTILPTPEYLVLIQQLINLYYTYPKEALAKGWEGIVRVKVTLGEDGRIKDIDIAESSGYPLLDAAAILAIKDASPYPFPKNYNYTKEGALEIILPVSYTQPKPKPSTTLEQPPPLAVAKETTALPEKAKEIASASYVQEALTEKETTEKDLSNTNIDKELSWQEEIPESAPQKVQELYYFIDLALKNNQPTKVALEEVELAKLKVTEAKRSLFPAFKVSGYNTTGEVYKIDYEEREAKFQLDQPIFYGGRLKDTLNQAKTNLEITQKNYDRLKLDVIQKTETSYYNLIAARMHLGLQETLEQEVKDMLEKIKKLAAVGMVIPLEITSADSWLQQLEFKMQGIKHDLFMAELTFKQVLNVKEAPRIEAELIEAKKLNLDLDKCLGVAFKSRPEVYLSELLVKFHNYGQKIERTKSNAFTVDFTSSYGLYEGHYKTEPWKDATNWYAGVKASLPWGASTFNNSYAKEKSQPRYGQTSPTESSTISAEFNLLDNLKRLSEKKTADIALMRTLSDFDETFKTITFEVQDAFLNYQKAVLQLNTAEAEMKYRRNEAEVIKIRSMVGETSLSNAMEALYNLAETQTKYIQALANYQISLANLKKATGYGIKI